MERIKAIKHLVLIFMDILGEGFFEILALKPGTYRRQKSDIINTKNIEPIKHFITTAENQIQKLTKTQGPLEDNEIYCRNTGSDKLLIPFLFLDEFIHLMSLMVNSDFNLMSFEDVLNFCIYWCNCHDDSYLQNPDPGMKDLLERKIISQKQYDEFQEFKTRSFRKEYYYVYRDVVNNRNSEASFFEWPIRKVSETIKIEEWNDDITSSRTIDRMKAETGSRRWNSVKDWVSIKACDRFHGKEEKLKEYEVFQSRILMAYLLENLVNSELLLKKFSQEELYTLSIKGLSYKPHN